jgi:hypothetical protein
MARMVAQKTGGGRIQVELDQDAVNQIWLQSGPGMLTKDEFSDPMKDSLERHLTDTEN